MADYKIKLGTEVDTGSIQTQLDNGKYKIKVGVDLDPTGLGTQVDNIKVGDIHKIKVGVHLKTSEINGQITKFNQNTNTAKLKLGIKLDTSDIKRQLGNLNLSDTGNGKSKGVSIPLNTKSLEESFERVAIAVEDIRDAIGTIDDKSDMKPLLSSINQITTALGKASDESETLVRSLSVLSGKDINLSLNLKLGDNITPTQRNTKYSIESEVSEDKLKEQIAYLRQLLRNKFGQDADRKLEN
jgi:hypothetical protein